MSGASHVAIAGAVNPATGAPVGASEQEEAKEEVETGATTTDGRVKRPGTDHPTPQPDADDDPADAPETEGTFLGISGDKWLAGGIGAVIGAGAVGIAWALCSD